MPHIDPTQWIADYGYLAVFLIVFMETAGVPLPGEITLILAGVAAHRGNLDLPLVIVIGATAAIIGDNVGYVIGRYGGRRVVLRLAHYGRVDSMLGWGERFFASHGGKTVFLARWTAGLRIFGAWIAGMTHMPWRTFFVWNAAGGITWVSATVLAGYFFSGSVERIEAYFGRAGMIAAVVVLGGGLLYGLHRLHQRQTAARKAEMAAAGDDGTPPADLLGGGGEADVAAGDDGPVDDGQVHGVVGDGRNGQADVGERLIEPP
jgi:membrane protein DedA with SNARE-associated domain